MSFVDVVLLVSLWKSTKAKRSDFSTFVDQTKMDEESSSKSISGDAWVTTTIALLVALVQLGIYNLMGYDEEKHDMVGEVPAHFLEFSFEIISSLIAFWFCMDNKNVSRQGNRNDPVWKPRGELPDLQQPNDGICSGSQSCHHTI